MFKVLVNFIFYIVSKLAEIILTPVVALLTSLFPDLGALITNVKYFLSNYVFDVLQWTKMFLINTLAFPQELLNFLISTFTILITIYISMHLYKGVMALYQKLKP